MGVGGPRRGGGTPSGWRDPVGGPRRGGGTPSGWRDPVGVGGPRRGGGTPSGWFTLFFKQKTPLTRRILFCGETGITRFACDRRLGGRQTKNPALCACFFVFPKTRKQVSGFLQNKKTAFQRVFCLRRDWDSNPGYPFEVHTLSRRAPSTTRTPLRRGCVFGCGCGCENEAAKIQIIMISQTVISPRSEVCSNCFTLSVE